MCTRYWKRSYLGIERFSIQILSFGINVMRAEPISGTVKVWNSFVTKKEEEWPRNIAFNFKPFHWSRWKLGWQYSIKWGKHYVESEIHGGKVKFIILVIKHTHGKFLNTSNVSLNYPYSFWKRGSSKFNLFRIKINSPWYDRFCSWNIEEM